MRDLKRLSLLGSYAIGQESLSTGILVSDFLRFCFSKVWTNLVTSFKSFGTAELTLFHQRHPGAVQKLLTRPLMQLDGVIVPIPKGMVQPYKPTLDALVKMLDGLSVETLEHDLETLKSALVAKSIKDVSLTAYPDNQFEADKVQLGKLFGTVGLSHMTADHALVSQADMIAVDKTLQDLTTTLYPSVMKFSGLLTAIEAAHAKLLLGEVDKKRLAALLLPLAHRLSIYALVLDHLQALEHQFTLCLTTLLKKSF